MAHPFEVNPSAERPSSVKKSRFLRLSRSSGAHWGQEYAGVTGRAPGLIDGHNVVGFSSSSGRGAGAQTYCFDGLVHRHASGRRHEHCAERDVMINPRVAWQQGPRYPSTSQCDLETVLLHEFGHFSGWWPMEGRRCTNSPMASPLYNGEWWRSRRDSHRVGCGRASVARRGLAPLEL